MTCNNVSKANPGECYLVTNTSENVTLKIRKVISKKLKLNFLVNTDPK